MPFRQADAFGSGAGLGVSISDAIVRRMNGTLRFASALGVGTTASISLPVRLTAAIRPSLAPSSIRTLSEELSALFKPLAVAEHIHELDEARSKMGTPRPVPELTPARTPVATSPQPLDSAGDDDDVFRVLIADDNPIGLRILATFLRTRGIVYSEAANGAKAIELFNSARYAVALLDVQMPVMSGIEASLQMRELELEHGWPRARIVAISGLSSELGSHARLLRDGTIDEWLTKVRFGAYLIRAASVATC